MRKHDSAMFEDEEKGDIGTGESFRVKQMAALLEETISLETEIKGNAATISERSWL